ncbi:MAG: diguanylate cyclase [Actinomycetota bacterium]
MRGIRRLVCASMVASALALGVSPATVSHAAPTEFDTIVVLGEALGALQRGDREAFEFTADELRRDGHWLPDLAWDALDEGDEAVLVLAWLLLESPGEEPLGFAVDQIAFEGELLEMARTTGVDDDLLEEVDADGQMVLQVLDRRGIEISPDAQRVLERLPDDLDFAPDAEVYDRVVDAMGERVRLDLPPPPAGERPIDPPNDFPVVDGDGPSDEVDRPADEAVTDVPPASPPRPTAPPAVVGGPEATIDGSGGPPASAESAGVGAPDAAADPITPDASESGLDLTTIVLATIALLGLFLGALAMRRNRHAERLTGIAYTDGLTGLANRRRLDDDLAEEARSGTRPTVVLMIDVDHFKRFNDTHGHGAGDDALRRVASIISRNVRAGDVAYRYGGEEFSVLLPDTSATQAAEVAERIRDAIERATIDLPDGESASVTVSIGLSSGPATSVTRLVDRADEALYQAKQTGRNRLILR